MGVDVTPMEKPNHAARGIEQGGYGLKTGRLSQWDMIAQSLANIAPTATPAMFVPMVIAASGAASGLVYLLATICAVCIAKNVNVFAQSSASPGSLYSFVRDEFGLRAGMVSGWALYIAYVGTAGAVTGGFTSYFCSLAGWKHAAPLAAAGAVLLPVVVSTVLAYKDVQLSTKLMLWIESISILLILSLFVWPGQGSILHFDRSQFLFTSFSPQQIQSGLVLAIFSFVGFESAATLGAEARSPLRTIPIAIRSTALFSGIFFIVSAYAETIGYHRLGNLFDAGAPLQVLSQSRGLGFFAPFLALGALFSFFACTLACITAGARTLFHMSRDGVAVPSWGKSHHKNQTPHTAVLLAGLAGGVPAAVLSFYGASAVDVNGWLGTLATFGFLTVYGMVCVGAQRRLLREKRLSVASVGSALISMFILTLAFWSGFDPTAAPAYRILPLLFAVLLAAGIGLSLTMQRRKYVSREIQPEPAAEPAAD
jgi:amino acid transporter